MKKVCNICNKELTLEHFHKSKNSKHGVYAICKECAKEQNRTWYKKNKERAAERRREWRAKRNKDSIKYISELMRNQVRRYIIKGKGETTKDIIGCEWHEVRSHIESLFIEGMSWSNHGEWHIDHIIPLAKGTTREELIELNHYTNLQPLWAADNLSKGASVGGVFSS